MHNDNIILSRNITEIINYYFSSIKSFLSKTVYTV